jgi:hypothetical protein
MQQISPDLGRYPEIIEFNREFIQLLAGPSAPEQDGLFGMPLESLRALRTGQENIKVLVDQVPCLLVELSPLLDQLLQSPVGLKHACNEPRPHEHDSWRTDVRVYTVGLLTYVWAASRRDPDAARLYLGLRAESIAALAEMTLAELGRLAESSPDRLRARFATNPRFWSDLISVAKLSPGNHDMSAVARLAALSLLVARTTSGGE